MDDDEVSIAGPAVSMAGPAVLDGGGGLDRRPAVSIAGPAAASAAAGVPVGPMVVGLNSGSWGVAGAQDIASGLSAIRWDSSSGEPLSDYTSQGLKADIAFPGPYSSSGVSAIDAGSWASSAISWYQSNCGGSVVTCPSIEVLNEPGGTWFWGSSAMSQSNAKAYDSLLQTVYNAFHSKYGAGAPKILGSYDGGHDSDIQWGQELYAATPTSATTSMAGRCTRTAAATAR